MRVSYEPRARPSPAYGAGERQGRGSAGRGQATKDAEPYGSRDHSLPPPEGLDEHRDREFIGHHRDTIARVLRSRLTSTGPAPAHQRRRRFDAQIRTWLDQHLSVQRMLELARGRPRPPLSGRTAAFYDYVRPLKRRARACPGTWPCALKGLPGELLQIDWGEIRRFPFTRAELAGRPATSSPPGSSTAAGCGCASRTDMREETLLRCLLACFVRPRRRPLGGHQRQHGDGHPRARCAATSRSGTRPTRSSPSSLAFIPMLCAPGAGQPEGRVENLVKFVKANFLPGRTFHDDADLATKCTAGCTQVNEVRLSDATEQLAGALLAAERPAFGPLPAGRARLRLLRHACWSNQESLVDHRHQPLLRAEPPGRAAR